MQQAIKNKSPISEDRAVSHSDLRSSYIDPPPFSGLEAHHGLPRVQSLLQIVLKGRFVNWQKDDVPVFPDPERAAWLRESWLIQQDLKSF
jgi:hypothetical protein